jgi:peptide/nickel transport system ATP-binding protein
LDGDYILEARNLQVSFGTYAGEVQAVRGASFELRQGEILAIVGESGSGKTTLAKTLMGLLPEPNSIVRGGEVTFEDRDLLKLSERQMRSVRGAKISMVFQDPMTTLNPTMRIGRQITENLNKPLGLSRRRAMVQAVELLRMLGIPNPEERIKQYPHQLSGGMRQRVVIAIALACDPQVLIADEPTTALDVTIQAQILELLRDLQETMETSIVLITHDLGIVANIADRVAVMYSGKIVETGTVREIFYEPQHPYTWGLLASIPLPAADRSQELISIPGSLPDPLDPPTGCPFTARCAHAMRICTTEMPRHTTFSKEHWSACWLHHDMAPKVISPRPARKHWLADQTITNQTITNNSASASNDDPGGRVLLRIEDLKKYFRVRRKSLKAVDGISLEIKKGETFGLVGESGCGKTTLGRVLVRLHEPTSGKVLYDGKDLFEAKDAEVKSLHRKVQMIFQDPQASLSPRMVAGDIIAEGIDIHGLAPDKKARFARVHELLETVGLDKEHANRYPHEFSSGQRQRISIARALAVDPEFVVADEPVSALDVSIQAQIINLMKSLQKEKDLTYLFISHDLSVVRYISDRIGVMYLGVLVEIADADQLYTDPLHPYTRALLSAIPVPDPDAEQKRIVLEGEVPIPTNPPSGCRFRTRCPHAMEVCSELVPKMRKLKPDHWVACHLYNDEQATQEGIEQ